jgi:hypothetical protein
MGHDGALAPLARTAERVRPLTLAKEQTLPVLEPLAPLFVDGALRRGATVSLGGTAATALAFALAAGPSGAGSWVGAVGLPSLGLLAAAELGVALERLVLVAEPPAEEWGTIVATMLDGMDVVLLRPPRYARAGTARRLQARARDRGAVLILLSSGSAFEPDLTMAVRAGEWLGLQAGAGYLRARRVTVEASGRRGAARVRRAELWLPDADGRVRVDEPATVTPLRIAEVAVRGAG